LTLWFGAKGTHLMVIVKVLLALWFAGLALLFFLPFWGSPSHG
jgi:hypothetical protein